MINFVIVISELRQDILYVGIEFVGIDSDFKDVAERDFHILFLNSKFRKL